MFTWEEAGLLRGMLLVLKWTAIAVLLSLVLLEHEPIVAALTGGLNAVRGVSHAGPAASVPGKP